MRRLVVLLLLASCGKSEAPKSGGPPGGSRKARVVVQTAEEKEVTATIEAVGSIEAKEEVTIPARVGGVVDWAEFKEGDRVISRTVLARIDLDRYGLAEERARADLQRAKAQRDLAARLYENRKKLEEEGRRQNKEWVTAEQMATWEADLKKAEADLGRALSDWRLAARNLDDARVRPPIAGTIQKKLVSRGQYVKPETAIATMLDTSEIHVRFTIPEVDAARIRDREAAVTFRIRSVPGKDFNAKLFHVGNQVDESTGTVECKALVLDPGEAIRPGTFAVVRLVNEKRRAVLVPERALLTTERGFVVYVAEGNKAFPKPVEVGLRSAEGIEILKGITAGQVIVVDGASSLRPGAEFDAGEKK